MRYDDDYNNYVTWFVRIIVNLWAGERRAAKELTLRNDVRIRPVIIVEVTPFSSYIPPRFSNRSQYFVVRLCVRSRLIHAEP